MLPGLPNNTEFYGYLPSKPPALFAITYFGLALVICLAQILFGRYKHYWMLTLAFAPLGEAIGWGARLWAHYQPADWMPYMIQICSLVVSPVCISAADYILFCVLVSRTGRRLFHLPNWVLWAIFVTFDVISLSIQTVGGVEVSSAANLKQFNHGRHVILGGIIFQLSNTIFFTVVMIATILFSRKSRATFLSKAGWPSMAAMAISTLMVLIRNTYRVFELRDGWDGHIMRTQGYLIRLDMVPMAVAVGAVIVFSPCMFLPPAKDSQNTHADTAEIGSGVRCGQTQSPWFQRCTLAKPSAEV